MDTTYKRISGVCTRTSGVILRKNMGWQCVRCQKMSTTSLRAAKASKPSPKKTQKQPLEYKTPISKLARVSQNSPKSRPNPFKNRIIPTVLGSFALLGFSGYVGYLYVAFTQPNVTPVPTTPSTQQDVSARYNTIANKFDDEVDSMENRMGYTSLRKKLASLAHGDVLEVSIGTGRNLEFYDWDFRGHRGVGKPDARGYVKKGTVRSFTAVDKSAEMLEIAHEKFGKMFPGILGVRWIVADAAEKGSIPGPPTGANERSGNLDQKYDTVVQTMGLCSASNPVGLLRNLGECVKEEGRILLLEHGRGRWEWLNHVLDKYAEAHAKEFGCWWNRDLREIVEKSGLEIVEIETPKWWHGGTTWWIELKKPRRLINKVDEAKEKVVQSTLTSVEPKKKGWW